MNMKKHLLCSTALSLSLIGAAFAESGDIRLDYEACRVLVEKGEIMSMSNLMSLASKEDSEIVLDAYLIHRGDLYIYELQTVGADGGVRYRYLDATNGALLDTQEAKQ